MSSKFESLQKKHQGFLQKQLSPSETDQPELSSGEIQAFIREIRAEGEHISRIEERERLRANLRYWANYIYGKEGIWPDTDLPETVPSKKTLRVDSHSRSAILAAVVIIVLLLGFFAGRVLIAQWTPTAPTPTVLLTVSPIVHYGFDEDAMGWVPRTQGGDLAVFNVNPQIKFGENSLELQIELIGTNDEKSKGEVFVDLSSNPPAGVFAPLNLNGKTITMLVYVPSAAAGNTNSPNGIQVFVRDIDDKSEYSAWTNLTSENTERWIKVTLVPLTSIVTKDPKGRPTGAAMDAGFDPTKINIIGLKIGAGDGFDSVFRGSIWIDNVSWQ